MNKSLVSALVILGALGVVVGAYFHATPRAPVSSPQPPSTAVSSDPALGLLPPTAPAASESNIAAASPAPAPKPAPGKPVTTINEPQHTFAAIDAAAEAETPESLEALVAYADTDNADIRSAALAGLVRRGDDAASPLLRAAAKKAESSAEIIALLQTADYLELPPADLKAITAKAKARKALFQQAADKLPTRPAPAAAATTPAPAP